MCILIADEAVSFRAGFSAIDFTSRCRERKWCSCQDISPYSFKTVVSICFIYFQRGRNSWNWLTAHALFAIMGDDLHFQYLAVT